MNKINNLAEFYEVVEKDELSLIYFYTTWCPDCFATKLYMPRLIKDYSNIKFYAVNRDELIDLSSHLGIYGIPSFLIYKNGEELGRFVSKLRKSYIEVKEFIDNSI
jgi:thiol-disulfide isomerase/thioredoxin